MLCKMDRINAGSNLGLGFGVNWQIVLLVQLSHLVKTFTLEHAMKAQTGVEV